MMKHKQGLRAQSGVMLIEALIAILIFSIGVLGIIGMQGSAVKVSVDARYRSEAALLANELIGRMWAGDRTQATLQANFASDAGPTYRQWAWVGAVAASPGTMAAPAAGTVLATLPGAAANPPAVVIQPVGGTLPSSIVTITIRWQVPGDTAVHSYVTTAQIGG